MFVLNTEQIRFLDKYTIDNTPISSLDLMERASEAFVKNLLEDYGSSDFIVLVGPGNNGGDGLAIVRLLFSSGKKVSIRLVEDVKLSVDANVNLKRLPAEVDVDPLSSLLNTSLGDEVFIDALFGSGLNRSLEKVLAKVVNYVNESANTVVSVDVPSGVSTDLLFFSESAIKADKTYSFQFAKHPFFFKEYESYVGECSVLEIGLLSTGLDSLELKVNLVNESYIKSLIKPRGKYSHKGTYGHACLAVGSKGMLGAALLSAKACLRTGVGLLTLNVPACAYELMQSSVPEAVVKTGKHEDYLSSWESGEFSAVGVGCGLSVSDDTKLFIEAILVDDSINNLLIDADGLNIISLKKEPKRLLKGVLITPHPKEFDRLFGLHSNTIDRYKTQLNVSKDLGCYILLKGAHTHITTPDGLTFINTTGNSGMATAGSGDVLTGIITGLLAQGYSKVEALVLGAYLHGWAGDYAANKFSEEALVSSDIVDAIPEFWKRFSS